MANYIAEKYQENDMNNNFDNNNNINIKEQNEIENNFVNNNNIINNNGYNMNNKYNIQNNLVGNINTINDSYDIDSMIINKINSFSTRRNNNPNNTINQCLNIIDNEDNSVEINNNINNQKNIENNNKIFKRDEIINNINIVNDNNDLNENNINNNNYIGGIKDDELKLNDLSKESNKKKYNSKTNYIYLDDEEYSENSLDQKIKKLQEKTFGKEKNENIEEYMYYNDINNTNKKFNKISNSGSNNSIFNSNKSLKRNNLNNSKKSKSSSKISYINKRSTKNNSIKRNNNKSKISQKQNTSIRSNGNNKNNLYSEFNVKTNDFYYGNDYDIKKYKNEIIHLKNTINRLKIENEKLKKNLQNERRQNKKFRQLTEEIIKHYEKTK